MIVETTCIGRLKTTTKGKLMRNTHMKQLTGQTGNAALTI